jgi:hypothetical protein
MSAVIDGRSPVTSAIGPAPPLVNQPVGTGQFAIFGHGSLAALSSHVPARNPSSGISAGTYAVSSCGRSSAAGSRARSRRITRCHASCARARVFFQVPFHVAIASPPSVRPSTPAACSVELNKKRVSLSARPSSVTSM